MSHAMSSGRQHTTESLLEGANVKEFLSIVFLQKQHTVGLTDFQSLQWQVDQESWHLRIVA